MALVPNPPTDYDALPASVCASKSGKTPFDARVLAALERIADALATAAPASPKRRTDA